MFNRLIRIFTITFAIFCSFAAQAVVIEAEGQALIVNGDLKNAREAAIKDASQQASMHAAVYVSSNQVVRDGILEIDNMQISTLGRVSNIDVLDEKIINNILHIRIKADVLIDTGCENGITNKYTKTLAVAAFPLVDMNQARLGNLHDAPIAFPTQLAQHINSDNSLTAYNASRVNLYPDPTLAATSTLSDGALTSMLSNINRMDVNYVISGVVRDMSMVDPRTHAEDNYFIDLYNRMDYLSKKHLRSFSIDLFVHDGFTGHLLMQKNYQTAGLWNLDPTIKTGFTGAGFIKQDYGQKVQELQQQMIKELSDKLLCEPFTARINRAEDSNIWISSGSAQGLKPGDKLTIYRRSTFFTPDMRAQTQYDNTRQSIVIEDVQGAFASGKINGTVEQYNIRPGDLVKSH
ncbi:MAG: flagellar assembly protein T N-terminal domain-containing protein [Neptuniibacter sp.]